MLDARELWGIELDEKFALRIGGLAGLFAQVVIELEDASSGV